jgi:hypothetical protein
LINRKSSRFNPDLPFSAGEGSAETSKLERLTTRMIASSAMLRKRTRPVIQLLFEIILILPS